MERRMEERELMSWLCHSSAQSTLLICKGRMSLCTCGAGDTWHNQVLPENKSGDPWSREVMTVNRYLWTASWLEIFSTQKPKVWTALWPRSGFLSDSFQEQQSLALRCYLKAMILTFWDGNVLGKKLCVAIIFQQQSEGCTFFFCFLFSRFLDNANQSCLQSPVAHSLQLCRIWDGHK